VRSLIFRQFRDFDKGDHETFKTLVLEVPVQLENHMSIPRRYTGPIVIRFDNREVNCILDTINLYSINCMTDRYFVVSRKERKGLNFADQRDVSLAYLLRAMRLKKCMSDKQALTSKVVECQARIEFLLGYGSES
jgi:hypothetical protein